MGKKREIQIAQPAAGQEEWEALKEPLMTGWLTTGPQVKAFEEAFAQRHNVSHAVAVTSATTALHLALTTLGIKPGDEVIVPAFTWVSTANVVLYCGADVVFADINTDTFNIDPVDLERRITEKTKAIIPVHLFGLCADMDAIKKVAGEIPLIEDAACAAGSAYKGKPAGGLGTIGCFSFHPRKLITTGEGGMLTTCNPGIADKAIVLRNHGASVPEEERHHGPRPYIMPDYNVMGYNYRMTDLQGAVGRVQLRKMDSYIDERNRWARFYSNQLAELDWLHTPEYNSDYDHSWQAYVTLVDEVRSPMPRNQLMEELQRAGISTRPGTHAVHMLKVYQDKYGLKPDDFPEAQLANNCSMALPLHNRMSGEDYEYVVRVIKELGA